MNKIILFETDKLLIFFLMHSVKYTTCIKILFFFKGSPYSNNNFLYSYNENIFTPYCEFPERNFLELALCSMQQSFVLQESHMKEWNTKNPVTNL